MGREKKAFEIEFKLQFFRQTLYAFFQVTDVVNYSLQFHYLPKEIDFFLLRRVFYVQF